MLGAPVGEKNRESEVSLPPYLGDLSPRSKKEFATVYLRNRSDLLSTGPIRFREQRPDDYLESLTQFLSEVTGEVVHLYGQNIVLSEEAGEVVRSWPVPLVDLE